MAKRKRKAAATKPKKATRPSSRERKTKPAKTKTKTKPKAASKKAPPAVKTGGAPRKHPKPTARKARATKAYGKPKRSVKQPPRKPPAKPPARPAKPPKPREVKGWQRGPSHHPEAVRSRKRRAVAGLTPKQIAARRRAAEKRGIADALAAEREEKRQRRNARARQRRQKAAAITPAARLRTSAEGWLEYIRDAIARQFPISVEIAPGAGKADREPWIVIGRYDFIDPVSYEELGDCFRLLRDDYALEASIHPERMSLIRVKYHDPNEKRGEGDRYISFGPAPWNHVIGEAAGDVIDAGEDSLAERYADTSITTFFVYFSANLENATDVSPWMPASAKPVDVPGENKKPKSKKAKKR